MGDIKPSELPDIGDKYELGQLLGGGIFGHVYEATEKEGGRKVAVKIQGFTANQRSIQEEYSILNEFSSLQLNLIDFYGIYSKGSDEVCLAIEYCEGGPIIDLVRGLIANDKRLSEQQIAFVLKEIIKALVFLHEKNVIHRNVRASNILLTKEGDVKLADFGQSCKLSTNMGKKKAIIGSPSWMAPEIVQGTTSEYGNRVDVWALGITAIELADGKAPFQDMHPTRALFQIVRNPPPQLHRPANWSTNLNDFITECLEKNQEYRPYSVELIEHPFIQEIPDNDYHLTQELKMLSAEHSRIGKENRLPERIIKDGLLRTEVNPEPETMYVEDLAALENLTEDRILNELQQKMERRSFQTFIGDFLLILNPNTDPDIYNNELHDKYKFKSRSDNAPHIYGVADSAYQDALHHDEPQYIIFSGESNSGKTTNMVHAMKHLIYLGQGQAATGQRIETAYKILNAAITASTPINPNSTRCVLQTQITYGKSGKLSGAIFWMYQLDKWRVSSTDMTQGNFDLIYYFYDGLESEDKLGEFSLEPDRKYRYLRVPESAAKVPSVRDDPAGNAIKFKEFEQNLKELEFDPHEIQSIWKTLAAILILGNVKFKDSNAGAAEVENLDEALKVAKLLELSEDKFGWALINYCLVEQGTAVKRKHSTDEARDARDVLASTIYRRLLDWLVNTINLKLSFGRSVFGDKYAISLLDMFGFECFHRNRLEQLIINTMNEQVQFLYNQRIFAWEMQEQEEEQVPVSALNFYDNKVTVDQLMARPLGLFYILDEACRTSGGQEYIMSTIKNSSKGPYVKLSGSHEFSVAHYTGKINYDARDLAEKNRDFLPPEMIETLRASNHQVVRHFFTNKLTKSGSLTAPSFTKSVLEKKDTTEQKTRKYNTESKGQFSQLHRMRTAAGTFRATSLELLRSLAVAPGAAGVAFVRCIRATLGSEPFGFQPDVVRQQLRALAILDTAKARQQGYSTRIPFAEFLRRYKFLAFDFDENVDITKDNCRLLLVRLKMEGWVIGKTKVFLKYYNEEYLARLYETQVKKIIKVQCMMRAFLARRKIEKSKQQKPMVEKKEEPNLSQEEAAIKIQKAFRGFAVRKAYGPLINRTTGKIDEETAEFLRRYTLKWRSKSIFQVLLQYRAARYQDLVNFSQQVHIFNQATMQCLMTTSTGVLLDRVDPQARPLEFLGPLQPTVWKVPFKIVELPYFDTTYMCDSSAKCNDTLALGYDSDPDTWDEPLKRRNYPASHSIQSSMQNAQNDKSTGIIHLTYSRDPTQPIRKLPSNYSPMPYNRQSYGNIQQQAWKEDNRPVVYKKKHSPSNVSRQNSLRNEGEDWQFPRLNPVKLDKKYGGSTTDISSPIRELKELARNQTDQSGDDPPYNFQAMLRKTPRNRASMKRTGEAVNADIIRPRSCQEFKRTDSAEIFKMALKRADSSQNFATRSNVETVHLAPGITVRGCIVDV